MHTFLLSVFQAIVLLAESGCSSVCNPKDGALCSFYSVMDEWQLWPLRCKYSKCFMSDFAEVKWMWQEISSIFLPLLQLEVTGTAIWINPFVGVLTITSLWPVAIVFMNTNSLLRSLKIVPKYAMYQVSQHNNFVLFILHFIVTTNDWNNTLCQILCVCLNTKKHVSC